jgi:hypothetical protein
MFYRPCCRTLWFYAIVLLLIPGSLSAVAAGPAIVQAVDEGMETRTGVFEANWGLPEWSEFSDGIAAYYARMGEPMPTDELANAVSALKKGQDSVAKKSDVQAAKPGGPENPLSVLRPPTFEVYVPAGYVYGKPAGLLVWLSSDNNGAVPADWQKVADAHNLICIGQEDFAAVSQWWYFMPHWIVRQAKRRFTIDDDRIYIAGHAAGGNMAGQIAQMDPDVFTGCISCDGFGFRKKVFLPNNKNKFWNGFWNKPDLQCLAKERRESRFVVVTGSKSSVHTYMTCEEAAMKEDGYRQATLLDVPDRDGATLPTGDVFEDAVAALDAPLSDTAEKLYQDALAAEKPHRLGVAYAKFAAAAQHAPDQPFAKPAQQKADALWQQYQAQVAQVHQFITDKQFDKAATAARALPDTWGPMAKETSLQLLHQISDARTGKH